MFQLSQKAICLGAIAINKQQAIEQVAKAMVQAGYVTVDYIEGMLLREQQTSTYIGNGIAIPHGTTATRNLVLKTGVQVFQFPQGVEWGEGQIAYIVIGIAAQSDEHLALLRQITHVLSDEKIAHQLAKTDSVEELQRLLTGADQATTFCFDRSYITLDVATDNITTLQAINAGRLQQLGAVNLQFVSEVISKRPLNLGQGIWLNDSVDGNVFSAIAICRPDHPFELDGEKVGLLLTPSVMDDQSFPILKRLSELLLAQRADCLLEGDAATLITLLTGENENSKEVLSAEFSVCNEHGLHARPSATLVNKIKQYSCDVTITNLDGSGIAANGRNLLQVIALEVQKGNRLRITVSGSDAKKALIAIGDIIQNGLGETV